jgi:hypothetical protein
VEEIGAEAEEEGVDRLVSLAFGHFGSRAGILCLVYSG